jgi:hypothetical protein
MAVLRLPVNSLPTCWHSLPVMLKAIQASEDVAAARDKAIRVINKLRASRLTRAAELVKAGFEETLTYYALPEEHWRRVRTNNSLEDVSGGGLGAPGRGHYRSAARHAVLAVDGVSDLNTKIYGDPTSIICITSSFAIRLDARPRQWRGQLAAVAPRLAGAREV